MKDIAYITHLASYNYYGGVETQLSNTQKYVNERSDEYKIHLFDMWPDDVKDFDVIHFFNPFYMSHETKMLVYKAKRYGVKIVTTPIFTFHRGASRINCAGSLSVFLENVFLKLRHRFSLFENLSYLDPFHNIQYLLENSDAIFCTSMFEEKNIIDLLQISGDVFQHVPNGIDAKFKHGDGKEFSDQVGVDDYVLFLGRIECIKNVDSLIKAFIKSDLPTKLVIVGEEKDQAYAEKCRGLANEDVIFHPHIPYDSSLLTSAYAGAKVFALPSYTETCGMSGLEAGLAGANVVVTDRGGTREYYGDYARYVDPYHVDSIKDGLIDAYNSEKSGALREHVERNFSWNVVIDRVLEAYGSLF